MVDNSLYDMILGADWIKKEKVVIFGESGRLVRNWSNDPHQFVTDKNVEETQQPPVILVTELSAEPKVFHWKRNQGLEYARQGKGCLRTLVWNGRHWFTDHLRSESVTFVLIPEEHEEV